MRNFFIVISLLLVLLTFSCGSDSTDTPILEPITFISPDSVFIEAMKGEEIVLNIQLTADEIIDTFIGAYSFDTIGNGYDISVMNADSIFLTENFIDSNNQQNYQGTFMVPDSIPGARMLMRDDLVRLIFYFETRNRSFEKQLRIQIK